MSDIYIKSQINQQPPLGETTQLPELLQMAMAALHPGPAELRAAARAAAATVAKEAAKRGEHPALIRKALIPRDCWWADGCW